MSTKHGLCPGAYFLRIMENLYSMRYWHKVYFLGVGTGMSVSMPRLSGQSDSSTGITEGVSMKETYTIPSVVILGAGYTQSQTYYPNGSSSSSGPSTVGGSPSASVTVGYTLKW